LEFNLGERTTTDRTIRMTAEYKHIVLGLVFLKYICDAF